MRATLQTSSMSSQRFTPPVPAPTLSKQIPTAYPQALVSESDFDMLHELAQKRQEAPSHRMDTARGLRLETHALQCDLETTQSNMSDVLLSYRLLPAIEPLQITRRQSKAAAAEHVWCLAAGIWVCSGKA